MHQESRCLALCYFYHCATCFVVSNVDYCSIVLLFNRLLTFSLRQLFLRFHYFVRESVRDLVFQGSMAVPSFDLMENLVIFSAECFLFLSILPLEIMLIEYHLCKVSSKMVRKIMIT